MLSSGGAICIVFKVGHQVASLALPHCFGLSYWHYQFVLTWYPHQPESHQLSLQKVAWRTDGHPDPKIGPGTPGSDKNTRNVEFSWVHCVLELSWVNTLDVEHIFVLVNQSIYLPECPRLNTWGIGHLLCLIYPEAEISGNIGNSLNIGKSRPRRTNGLNRRLFIVSTAWLSSLASFQQKYSAIFQTLNTSKR